MNSCLVLILYSNKQRTKANREVEKIDIDNKRTETALNVRNANRAIFTIRYIVS